MLTHTGRGEGERGSDADSNRERTGAEKRWCQSARRPPSLCLSTSPEEGASGCRGKRVLVSQVFALWDDLIFRNRMNNF